MDSIIVTIRVPSLGEEFDLEIPAEASIKGLIGMLVSTMGLDPGDGQISPWKATVEPGSRVLKRNDTLLDAGVVDGNILVIDKA